MRLVTSLFVSVARVSGGVSSLFHYFAASTLRLAEIKKGIQNSWQGFNSREADVAAGLMSWEEDVIQRFVKPGAAVLLVGCGSGRDLLRLVERGCRVTGIDPASIALSNAQRALRQRQFSADLIEGFFEDVRLPGPFDVVMFSYYTYSYIPESRRRIGVLREAAAQLTAGGHILISYPILKRPRAVIIRLARSVGALCGSDWRVEPGDLVLPHNGPFYDYAHAFLPEEIGKEAAAADLRIVYCREWPQDPVVVALA